MHMQHLVPYGKVVRPLNLIARLTWTDPVLQMGDVDVLSTIYNQEFESFDE